MSKQGRAKLARLQRLEKVRAVAKRTAMIEAAQAEGTLGQLRALGERTQRLADEYARRGGATDGAALAGIGAFASGLGRLAGNTRDEVERARTLADARLRALAEAERRRAAVEERATLQARLLARALHEHPTGARRKSADPAEGNGTELE